MNNPDFIVCNLMENSIGLKKGKGTEFFFLFLFNMHLYNDNRTYIYNKSFKGTEMKERLQIILVFISLVYYAQCLPLSPVSTTSERKEMSLSHDVMSGSDITA